MPNNIYPATSPYYNTKITNAKFLDVLEYRFIPKNQSIFDLGQIILEALTMIMDFDFIM